MGPRGEAPRRQRANMGTAGGEFVPADLAHEAARDPARTRAPDPLCSVCGQHHRSQDNHLYNYRLEVDDDLVCHICLQPLVQPLDTPCGHTFCTLCLRSFLRDRDFCPLDRSRLQGALCRRSSILVHNLLDKLAVTCPFSPVCTLSLPRGDLEAHLQHRCPGMRSWREGLERPSPVDELGGVAPWCPQAERERSPLSPGRIFPTCGSASMWTSEPGVDNPAFEEGTDEDNCKKLPAVPEGEVTTIEVSRSNPYAELGISVVGGNETPLINLVIQEVYREGTIALDGRLLAGDQILQVNDVDISNVPHSIARATLSQPCSELQLTVLRERRLGSRSVAPPTTPTTPTTPTSPEGQLHITLHKRNSSEQLGIKLVRRADEAGVFVLDLLEGGLAAQDGRLCSNDRILAINEHDLRHGTPEQAAQVIQASGERVHLLIGRASKQIPPPPHRTSPVEEAWGHESPLPLPQSCAASPVLVQQRVNSRDLSQCVTCQEKHVEVQKEAHESLGMTVAGGRGSKSGELPIFVTSVQPHGCLSRDGRIKRGDVLLSINGQDLTSLSHSEAVGTLKASAASSSVLLRALEVTVVDDPDPSTTCHSTCNASWSPSWIMWLGLPSYLHSSHEVILRRSHPGSWGFSIVGGYEENHGNQPFFIKTIVLGTPAYYDGRLKCGDMIVAVNGLATAGMSHSVLVPMLKEQRGRVSLTVVSWPGSLV